VKAEVLASFEGCRDQTVSVYAGCWGRWTGPVLPSGRSLLLPVTPRDTNARGRGPDPRRSLHRLHARLLRLLLEDVD